MKGSRLRRGWAIALGAALLVLGACQRFDAEPGTAAESDGGERGREAEASGDAASDAQFQIEADAQADAGADARSDGPPGPPSDGVCEGGLTYRGSFATWYGKVNVHTLPDGTWARDEDCLSGANVDPLVYCKAFWPVTSTALEEPLDPAPKPFWNAGCEVVAEFAGEHQYKCCSLP